MNCPPSHQSWGLRLFQHSLREYDALWFAIDNAAAQAKLGNNRAIILIGDGKDENADHTANGSVKTLSEVIAHAQENQVTIFTIGMGTVLTNVMTSLANETGGQYFPVPDSTRLASIYTAIRNIIAGEYTMEVTTVFGNRSLKRKLKGRDHPTPPSAWKPDVIREKRLYVVYRYTILQITFEPIATCQLRSYSILSLDARPASRSVPYSYLRNLYGRPYMSSHSSIPLIE